MKETSGKQKSNSSTQKDTHKQYYYVISHINEEILLLRKLFVKIDTCKQSNTLSIV